MAASESSPNTTDNRARSFRTRVALLLDVRTANGGGWDRAADHAGDCDQGQDVRERLKQQRPGGGLIGREVGEARRQCARERSEEHTSELQSQSNLVCRLLLEKKKK